jgi:phosphoheptose isomerase
MPTGSPLLAHPDEVRGVLGAHVDRLAAALPVLRAAAPTLGSWGTDLAGRLLTGSRLLAAGNGGSAAEAQHLTAELVGRFDGERCPLAAIALHADTSSVTAIGNDYGYEQVYARQVRAHARPGDVVVLFSTSGASPNLLAAATAAAGAAIASETGAAEPRGLAGGAVVAAALAVAGPHVFGATRRGIL